MDCRPECVLTRSSIQAVCSRVSISVNSDLFGVLNLSKPAGMTSRDLVNRIQKLVRPAKTGHAGTLDPMATGVLLVCVGPATRLVTMLQEQPKTYVAEFTLGQTSDTDDSTGVVQMQPVVQPPTLDSIVECLRTMTGVISQVPPDYSAVHVDGQRAYALARSGQEVVLRAKEIEVHSIEILHYQWPILQLEIRCGSGTYVRSIARDLGQQLGCGGLMSALERTRIGTFAVTESLDVNKLSERNLNDHLCPAIRIVDALPKRDCSPEDVRNIQCGRRLVCDDSLRQRLSSQGSGTQVALTRCQETELLALAELTDDGMLQPKIVFIKVQGS